jgi:surface antigen
MLRVARVVAGVALAIAAAGASPSALAKPIVAKNLTADILSNGGGNRLDVVVHVVTGRPSRRCDGVATLHGRRSRLRTLVTGAKGGRQWHWYLGDGAQRGRLIVSVACRFPDGKTAKRVVRANVGPGPYPRRPFKHVVQPHSLRVEAWTPAGKYEGSGGSADLYPKGQCTWYVSRERPDLPYFTGRDGDAKNWIASAERLRLPTGREPRVGAVAVFQPGQYGAGIFGHVAYVTKVDGDRITVREANYGKRAIGSTRTTGWAGVRFIYTEALPSPQLAPTPQVGPPGPASLFTPPAITPTKGLPSWPDIDLKTSFDARFKGASGGGAPAGDVNGDGYEDFVVTGNAVWVVFGLPSLSGRTDLYNDLGSRGFRVDGEHGAFGGAVGGADGIGDVNGDGKDDIVIGWSDASENGRSESGSAYIVFGKAGSGTVSLATLGSDGQGYRIDGRTAEDHAGASVSGVGDVNGDGRSDIVIGAPDADVNSKVDAGAAYLVWGKSSSTPIDLATLGTNGYPIYGAAADDHAGSTVAGIGKTDGYTDIAVGAPAAASSAGRAYVVRYDFVSQGVTLPPEGVSSGNTALVIADTALADRLGTVVAGVGDVNGDGHPDVAVTVPNTDFNGSDSGSTYIVFLKDGLRSTIDVDHLGSGGFHIDGADSGHGMSLRVSGAGDFNGDGLDDLLVGESQTDFVGRTDAGSAFVVFGKRDSTTVDLVSMAHTAGFAIGGEAAHDAAGSAVNQAGDINGDGRGDLLVTAYYAENTYPPPPPPTVSTGGTTYVVFGRPAPAS